MNQRVKKFSQILPVLLLVLFSVVPAAYGADSPALLDEVRSLVREQYIYPVDERILQLDTAEGIIDALGDPHSEFLSGEELEDLMDSTNGAYAGVGMELTLQPDGDAVYPTVVSTFAGSPARKAGIVPGDRIIAVDGKSTRGNDIGTTVSLIKGTPGSQVSLTIARGTASSPFSVKLSRELIHVDVVTYKALGDNIGYIGMSVFSSTAGQEVRDAVEALQEEGCKGIILDLRGNPGGYLEAGVETAGVFIPHGEPVMHIRSRQGSVSMKSQGYPVGLPLVVLVNSESASASEIVAGAIKDYGAGILVGTTTYGKGTVQTVQQLTSVPDAAVKLTIAEYLSPKGNKINGIGVKPDYYAEGADKQLETAEKVLLDRMDNEGEEGAKTLLLDPGRKTAYLDGLKVAAAQGEPFLEENTLMVPLRLVGVFLDGSLSWDDSAGTATLEYGDSKAVISAGEKSVSIGAGTAVLPVSPKMVKGRMYVPLRLLSSFKGITVDWDPVLDCAEVSRNY